MHAYVYVFENQKKWLFASSSSLFLPNVLLASTPLIDADGSSSSGGGIVQLLYIAAPRDARQALSMYQRVKAIATAAATAAAAGSVSFYFPITAARVGKLRPTGERARTNTKL